MIAENLRTIRMELPPQVKLVAVSKFHPAEAIKEAYDAGQRAFGESRPQEFAEKARMLPGDIEWHFIGHLQRNKIKLVLPYVHLIESVDSVELLDAIERFCAEAGKTVEVLIECHIAREPEKSGFTPEEALSLLTGERTWQHIHIRGLMGMATFTDDEDIVREDFTRLTTLNAALQPLRGLCPNIPSDFNLMSFGMSGDYRIAVGMGSNIVRIGTAIFGERAY
ncbi:MAG: YggS family pyridoxal phosphate-dependent enzyme [Candidatus Cryptobacteroides sp.]